eukprot:2180885-Rhodomonas_salina.1
MATVEGPQCLVPDADGVQADRAFQHSGALHLIAHLTLHLDFSTRCLKCHVLLSQPLPLFPFLFFQP